MVLVESLGMFLIRPDHNDEMDCDELFFEYSPSDEKKIIHYPLDLYPQKSTYLLTLLSGQTMILVD